LILSFVYREDLKVSKGEKESGEQEGRKQEWRELSPTCTSHSNSKSAISGLDHHRVKETQFLASTSRMRRKVTMLCIL
jgi:hypothetical protein